MGSEIPRGLPQSPSGPLCGAYIVEDSPLHLSRSVGKSPGLRILAFWGEDGRGGWESGGCAGQAERCGPPTQRPRVGSSLAG